MQNSNNDVSAIGYCAPMKGYPVQVYPVYRHEPNADTIFRQIYSQLDGPVHLHRATSTDLPVQLFPDGFKFETTLSKLGTEPVICLRVSQDRFVMGRVSDIHSTLGRMLGEGFFVQNPFLGIEVAQSVKALSLEKRFAKLCVDRLSAKSIPLAAQWLKHANLDPKAKQSATKQFSSVVETRSAQQRGDITTSDLSDKRYREEAWDRLEKAYAAEQRVDGVIFGRVKGGFNVDLGGAVAFLPGSQVDVRPVRDAGPLMGMKQPFQILKMDRRRGNIVVSRRAILEESRAEQRAEVIGNLTEGQTVDGVVKDITEYGAFVDLGGVDGLLHVTDMAWRRINHPSEILAIGETVKVQVIKINKDTHRISLGMKQLQSDPWDAVEKMYALGTQHKGRVTNITDYGAFVELEAGVEGLVHVSEMSWTKKNVHPGKIVSTSQEVEVMVLEIDSTKRRVWLGLKQTQRNPWEVFAETHPVGSIIEGEVKNITEFGLFVGLPGNIDGFVHVSDLYWDRSTEYVISDFPKGATVQASVMEVDVRKERISLSIKATGDGRYSSQTGEVKRGSIITVEVTKIEEGGIEVIFEGIRAFIRRSELSLDRADQRPERFPVGSKMEVFVTNAFSNSKRLDLSIKALERAEQKDAIARYGSSGSGATLGEILGAALKSGSSRKPR